MQAWFTGTKIKFPVCPTLSMQTSMNVSAILTTAMRMRTALTQREVSPAPVTLATLEMESTVQVSYYVYTFYEERTIAIDLHSFNLQISMSVNWALHVIPMQTALIQLAVLIASVMLGILELD